MNKSIIYVYIIHANPPGYPPVKGGGQGVLDFDGPRCGIWDLGHPLTNRSLFSRDTDREQNTVIRYKTPPIHTPKNTFYNTLWNNRRNTF